MQIFHVPDMTCGGCVRAITNAVKDADPSAEIAADVPSHLVRIESTQPTAALIAAMREAGFSPEPA